MQRRAGILVHPTSLPGPFAVGDLGPASERFLAWLQAAGGTLWQVLPLGPTFESGSPYGTTSAFAGNPLLISPERLVEDGLLPAGTLADAVGELPTAVGRVDLAAAARWKEALLREAWEGFRRSPPPALREALREFAADPAHAWLHDWELFSALRAHFRGRSWTEWPAALARRAPRALEEARRQLLAETGYHRFVQFLFFTQWRRLRAAARERGILVVGDVPIYVAHDSADVWAHPELFDLDESGMPRHVSGVPPDYFSPTGQRWGNPLYRWDRLAADGYRWWTERLRANLELADWVRLDHFRGLAAYWEVPESEPDAMRGRWAPGPGRALLDALRGALGELPIVAEDLGVITPDVEALRDGAGLPGMRVLQFAFSGEESTHLPHRHVPHCVVYTGTHDNDTTLGWFVAASPEERERVLDYVGGDGIEPHWDLIRAAFTSVAEWAVVPLQDVLGLGSEARMNTPGVAAGNWSWRAPPDALRDAEARRLRRLAELTGRAPAVARGGVA